MTFLMREGSLPPREAATPLASMRRIEESATFAGAFLEGFEAEVSFLGALEAGVSIFFAAFSLAGAFSSTLGFGASFGLLSFAATSTIGALFLLARYFAKASLLSCKHGLTPESLSSSRNEGPLELM